MKILKQNKKVMLKLKNKQTTKSRTLLTEMGNAFDGLCSRLNTGEIKNLGLPKAHVNRIHIN